MDIFTPEQEEKIKLMLAAQRMEIDAAYTAKARHFRAWIETNPLLASRIAVGVGAALGAGALWAIQTVLHWI